MFPEWRNYLNSTEEQEDEMDSSYITADEARERLANYMVDTDSTETNKPWCILPTHQEGSLTPTELKYLITYKSDLHVIVEGFHAYGYSSAEEELSRTKLNDLKDMLKRQDSEPKPEPIEHDMYRVNRVTYHDGHTQFKIMKGRAKGGEPIEDSFTMAKGTRLMDNLDEAIAKCNELMSEVVIDEGKAYTPILATKPKENEGTKDWSDY